MESIVEIKKDKKYSYPTKHPDVYEREWLFRIGDNNALYFSIRQGKKGPSSNRRNSQRYMYSSSQANLAVPWNVLFE